LTLGAESGNSLQYLGGAADRSSEATVTKADIVESVYEKVGFSKKEAAEIVEMVFDTIKETLERGEKIKISGFGNFIVRDKKARVGRNPQTGREIEISARRVLTFRPSQVLKNALNNNAGAPSVPAQG
jgi:integration host factor subunit alpha